MKKMTIFELSEVFENAIAEGRRMHGFICFKASSFNDKTLTEKDRTYRVCSNDRGWDPSRMDGCIIGDCLNGRHSGVRLDWRDWSVEYCYIE